MQQEQGKPTVIHGYVIQTWRSGDAWYQHSDQKAYAPKGQLPDEWEQIKQDEAVREAKIFSTTQLTKQAQKRKIADHFKRDA